MRGTAYEGKLALPLGDSRVDAKGIADTLDVDADFAPLHLADLLPDAGGTLRGTLQLRGPRAAPDIDADLTGSGLRIRRLARRHAARARQAAVARRPRRAAVRASGLRPACPSTACASTRAARSNSCHSMRSARRRRRVALARQLAQRGAAGRAAWRRCS